MAEASTATLLRALRSCGLFDPAAIAAFSSAAGWWGASAATPVAAAALRHPRRTALIDDHGSLTYRQLDWRSTRAARGLERRGVGDDGVDGIGAVGLLCRNHRGFVEANLAVAKAGARAVYLNTGLPASQLREVMAREGVRAVIADIDLAQTAVEADAGAEVFLSAPEADPEWSFPDLDAPRLPLHRPRPRAAAPPVLLTSGTSGAPKGTQRSSDPRAALGAVGFLESIPFRRGDVFVVPAPLFHAWGLGQLMVCSTLAGTLVLRRKFDPEMVARDVATHRADVLAAVPSMLHRMLEAPATADLASLRITATSGSALPGELAQRWMDTHGDTLHNVYGSTEVGQVSVADPTDLRAAPGTAGRPIRGVDLRIVDEAGQPVAAGRDGRIVVASAMHFDGYTGGGTKPVIDGHMEIGDRGRIDANGRLFVLGRADDMIISGGENLYPSLIERSILADDRVADVAVVGVDDVDLGQRVRAVIVPRPRTRTATLTADLRERLSGELARYEIPREFVYVDELPRNPTGKIFRNRIDGDIESIPHRKPTKEST